MFSSSLYLIFFVYSEPSRISLKISNMFILAFILCPILCFPRSYFCFLGSVLFFSYSWFFDDSWLFGHICK